MYQASVRSTTAGTAKTVLAIVATLSLLLSVFAVAGPVMAQGEGEADCPAGTVRLVNLNEGDIEVGDELVTGVFVRAVTRENGDTGQLTSVTIENTTTENVTIAVKGGSDQVGNFVTIAPGDTETISVTNNPTISNLTVCQGPEIVENDETVTVIKELVGDTTGTFDLLINGTAEAEGVGDGGRTGAVVTAEGSVTVSEAGANGTDLANYTSSISCMAGETEVATGSGTSLTFTLEDNQDVVCTITNTLNEQQRGEGFVEVDKMICLAETASTGFVVTHAPIQSLNAPSDGESLDDIGDCVLGANVTFSVYVDANANQILDEGEMLAEDEDLIDGTLTTDENGAITIDLAEGDYILVEAPGGIEQGDWPGGSVAFSVADGELTLIEVTNNIAEEGENGLLKIRKFFCTTEAPEGFDNPHFIVLEGASADSDTSLPDQFAENCTRGGENPEATFTVDGVDPQMTDDGLLVLQLGVGEHTIAETAPNAGSVDVTIGEEVTSLLVLNFEEQPEQELGSITVTKVVDCAECETRTIGYYFNVADQHEEETNDLFTALGGIEADGITFTNVDQVQQYRADDQNGTSDGQNGLSARGQLTLQYLGAVLNTARNGDDCDLASQVYNNADSPFDRWTVQDILDEAVAAFNGTSSYTDQQIQSALDDINNSSHEEESPLSCEGSASGTLDDVTFDIYLAAEYPDGDRLDSQTTANGGIATFTDLTIGEDYVIVESGFPDEMTCTIVDVQGGNAEVIDGAIHVTLTAEDADLELTAVNDCEQPTEEEEFGEIEIVKSAEDDPEASFAFSATWNSEGFVLSDGDSEFSGLLAAGESFTVTEELTEEQIAAGWSLEDIDCGDATVGLGEDGMSVTITVVADETITCTFTNEQEEQQIGQGELELIKWFCPQVDEPQIIVLGPVGEEPLPELRAQAEDESTLPSQDGCSLGATADGETVAEFTITGGPEGFEEMTVETSLDEILTLDLDPGSYTITESNTGLMANFTIEEGEDTAVVVFNYLAEEQGQGRLKIIKFFCDGAADDVVFSIVEGSDLSVGDVDVPDEATNCDIGDAAFSLNGGATFTVGSDGIRLLPLDEGSYSLSEIAPNAGTSDEFDVTADETTTVVVFNLAGEGTGAEETVSVSIMKHLCADVSSVEEFEAVEDAGVAGLPGGQGTLSGLAATVLACPTIVLTGDVPTSGAVSGGNVDFDFSVIDSSGTQVLSSDGAFEAEALCESAIDVDVNSDGDKADCLDTSHYMFEVVDGVVVITETDAPDGSTGVGTLRFTPGSEDETALVGTIGSVETSGTIVLDTTQASETALEDGTIMLHVYNFAEAGTTPNQGGAVNEGTKANQGGPRQGTLAGNLPNTATEPFNGTSMPVALVALLMLTGLGAAAYAMKTEAARRR